LVIKKGKRKGIKDLLRKRHSNIYESWVLKVAMKKVGSLSKKDVTALSNVMKNATTVELHVSDFEVVREFYKGIGFKIIFDSPGNYLVMRKGKAILNFWGEKGQFPNKQPYFRKFPKDTKKGYGVEIVVPIKNIEVYYDKIKDKVNVVEKLKMKPWKWKDFRIEDPNGYYIRFTESHDWVFEFKGYKMD